MTEKEHLTSDEASFLYENTDVFIEQVRTIKGDNFSLDERGYLRDIYHQFSLIPREDRKPTIVVLYCSRKVEKTETIINLMLIPEMLLDYFTFTYTAPRGQQISDFSVKRFTEAVTTSKNGIIDAKLRRPTSVSHKMFTADPDGKWFNHLYLYSAWGDAASLLGQEGDGVACDEFQDFVPGTLPKIMEIVTLSKYKWIVISGTARDEGDDFHKTFQKSDMREWEVTCIHCGHRQFLEFESTIQGKEGDYYKGCARCKKELDIGAGQWKATNEDKSQFVGYHIHQLMHPVITANEIMLKKEYYESERLFFNEVLGLPYSGGSRPVTIAEILACCDKKLKYKFRDESAGNVGGMDTGKQHTITIMSKDKVILHQEVVDTTRYKTTQDEEEHVANVIKRFNCSIFVIDWGYTGQIFIKDLQVQFGDRVRGCRYGTTDVTNWMKYEEFEKVGKQKIPIYRYNVFRSIAMEVVMEAFQKKKITIPYAVDGGTRDMAETTFTNYTNVTSNAEDKFEKKEYEKKRSREQYTMYGRSGPDHFFHTIVYCFIGLIRQRKRGVYVKSV